MNDGWRLGGFGLYVHWPFCDAKCPYCDFNSFVSNRIDVDAWASAYLAQLGQYGAETKGRVLNSVYFGGGTPSLMPPSLVASIFDTIGDFWIFANDFEATLEANPGSVEKERFKEYRAAGINRLSLGVQALDDQALKSLGRIHSVAEALEALDVARNVFDRVSFDLIYARQHQSLVSWRNELSRALSFQPEHLSLYQLTIEEGTAFGERAKKGLLKGLPDDDTGADMYFATQDLCNAAGLPAYEISNHAKPGDESRHNMMYWRGGDYIGIGPGAHGRLSLDGARYATETVLLPDDWLSRANAGQTCETMRTRLSQKDVSNEYLMMSLRTSEGVDLRRLRTLPHLDVIGELVDMGFVEHRQDRLIATLKGRAILNRLIFALLPD